MDWPLYGAPAQSKEALHAAAPALLQAAQIVLARLDLAAEGLPEGKSFPAMATRESLRRAIRQAVGPEEVTG